MERDKIQIEYVTDKADFGNTGFNEEETAIRKRINSKNDNIQEDIKMSSFCNQSLDNYQSKVLEDEVPVVLDRILTIAREILSLTEHALPIENK